MKTTTTNKALAALEERRDAALDKIKARAGKIRAILDERERYVKESYGREQDELKAKAAESGDVTRCSQAIDRLEAMIPQEVTRDLSRRQAEIRSLEQKRREHERELHGVKHDIKRIEDRPGPRDLGVIKTLREQSVSLEALIHECDVDLEDARAGLDAAQTIRREALESLTEEAEKELAGLGPSS